jgi:hypothetical protein
MINDKTPSLIPSVPLDVSDILNFGNLRELSKFSESLVRFISIRSFTDDADHPILTEEMTLLSERTDLLKTAVFYMRLMTVLSEQQFKAQIKQKIVNHLLLTLKSSNLDRSTKEELSLELMSVDLSALFED